jgi:Proline racemase
MLRSGLGVSQNPFDGTHDPWEATKLTNVLVWFLDYHTAGEPFRIVRPQATISGETVAERWVSAIGDADIQALRRFLCFEPRGHADMYGGFLVPADDDSSSTRPTPWVRASCSGELLSSC